ncbi:MAG: methyl-accepting chemotaxis protein [Erythrobacter sp.]
MNAHTIDMDPVSGDSSTFDEEGDALSDAAINWWDAAFQSRSLSAKLRAVVFGAALIPFLVACVMLGQFGFFGQAGTEHADRVRAEILVAHGSLAMAQAARDLSDAVDQSDPAKLDSAAEEIVQTRDDLSQAMTVGADLYPDDIMANIAWLHDQADGEIAVVRSLDVNSSSQDIEQLEQRIAEHAVELRGVFNAAQTYAKGKITWILDAILVGFIACAGLILVSFLATIFGARALIANIVGHITNMTQAMQEVADGDAESPIPGRNRRDEIGAMARSLTVFRSSMLKLRNLTDARAQDAEKQLAQQQLVAEQLRDLRRDKRQLLEGLADGFEVSVGDVITAVSTASTQLKATSRQMGELAEGSSGQAQRAADAMESATANVTAAAAATDEFSHSISEISQQAAASAQLARNASELVTTANTKMTDLSNAALEIGEIAGMIQTIAQRTNLLALNASIEAARGGEAGRGFAVVASEVKELAMQTSNATSSVAEKISAMQDFTRSSAGDLRGIVDHIGELEKASVMIASAVDQQSVSGEELARNIETVASSSSQVEERLGSLREASRETGSAAEDVVSSAKALGDHADDLRGKAGRFIADVRRSARDLEAGEANLQSQSH